MVSTTITTRRALSGSGKRSTYLTAVGAPQDALPVFVVDGIGDAHGLADDVDAAEDAARGGRGEGEHCNALSVVLARDSRGLS